MANEGLRADLAHERACSSTMEADLREATRAGERLRSEVSVLAAERDSLKGLCEQLQSSLQAQQRQSEASLKMLHQRQSALERAEREAHAQMDEWSTLQEVQYMRGSILLHVSQYRCHTLSIFVAYLLLYSTRP